VQYKQTHYSFFSLNSAVLISVFSSFPTNYIVCVSVFVCVKLGCLSTYSYGTEIERLKQELLALKEPKPLPSPDAKEEEEVLSPPLDESKDSGDLEPAPPVVEPPAVVAPAPTSNNDAEIETLRAEIAALVRLSETRILSLIFFFFFFLV